MHSIATEFKVTVKLQDNEENENNEEKEANRILYAVFQKPQISRACLAEPQKISPSSYEDNSDDEGEEQDFVEYDEGEEQEDDSEDNSDYEEDFVEYDEGEEQGFVEYDKGE